MKWCDKDGKPEEPNWNDSTLSKTMEDQQDCDAVASALEVGTTSSGELLGPSVTVGGNKYEVIQVALPFFDSITDNLKPDVGRAVYLQRSPKERLLDMKIDQKLVAEKLKVDAKTKDEGLQKALRGRQVAAYLKNWSAKQRKEMEEHGVSREETLRGVVPATGKKC